MVFPFLPCSSMCITGQTRFVYKLLRHLKDMYVEDTPERILYCYGIHQPLFEEMEKTIPRLSFHKGLPSMQTVDEFTAERRHRLIVLDDLMHRVVRDVDMKLLFTQGCHHRRLSVLFLTQNVYDPRNQIENHQSEHHLPSADEKRAGRLSDHHLGETTLSRTLESAHRDERRCRFDALRVSGRRHVAAFRRHLHIENVRVPVRGSDGLRPQKRHKRKESHRARIKSRILEEQVH